MLRKSGNQEDNSSLNMNNTELSSTTDASSRAFIPSAYPDDPPDAANRPSVLMGTAGYIIVTEFCERLTYYGFAGSLVLFFQTRMGLTNAQADIQFSAWSGMAYITPLIGGYIADTYLGRYYTILVFCSIYIVGLVLIDIACVPAGTSNVLVFFAIYTIALGTGGIKPNVSTLGADQFDEKYSQDRKEKESFFNWFYWSINFAAIFSYTLVAYICQSGVPGLGGEKWGFFVGYMIPCIMMVLGTAIFVSGKDKYTTYPPKGSVLSTACKILWEAVFTRRAQTLVSRTPGPPVSESGIVAKPVQVSPATENPAPVHTLDRACTRFGGSFLPVQVEGVKLVVRLAPFLLALVPFWGIYSQMSTAFQNQGCQMNLNMGSTTVPISALNLFDSLAIVVFVPLCDQVVFPFLKNRGYSVSILQRMGAGFIFAMAAMLLAAWVEIYRLRTAPAAGDWYDVSARDNITPCQSIDDFNPYNYQSWQAGIGDVSEPLYCSQTCPYTHPNGDGVEVLDLDCISCEDIPQMSNMSIFWQIPQFMFVGMSEILASVASLEFFYTQAPLSMRSLIQALNLCTTAFGSFLVIPLVLLVNSNPNDQWLPENLDEGHLADYFVVLAALMAANMVYFYHISKDYEYKSQQELKHLDDLDDGSGGARSGDSESGLLSEREGENEDYEDETGDAGSAKSDSSYSSEHGTRPADVELASMNPMIN